MDHIREHCGEDLDLEKIARVACFSKYHFHRIFHQLNGETAIAFVRRMRIEKAVRRLATEGETPITTIALECGFSTSQNFARAFRMQYGLTPKVLQQFWNENRNAIADPEGYRAVVEELAVFYPSCREILPTLAKIADRDPVLTTDRTSNC